MVSDKFRKISQTVEPIAICWSKNWQRDFDVEKNLVGWHFVFEGGKSQIKSSWAISVILGAVYISILIVPSSPETVA